MRTPVLLVVFAACAAAPGRATREADGSWVRGFRTDRDTAYHAALWVLLDRGYSVEKASPLGGSFTAKSEIDVGGLGLTYTLARVEVESHGDRCRIRLLLVDTREPAGGGRKPNNDRQVGDPARYEELFDAIEEVLEP